MGKLVPKLRERSHNTAKRAHTTTSEFLSCHNRKVSLMNAIQTAFGTLSSRDAQSQPSPSYDRSSLATVRRSDSNCGAYSTRHEHHFFSGSPLEKDRAPSCKIKWSRNPHFHTLGRETKYSHNHKIPNFGFCIKTLKRRGYAESMLHAAKVVAIDIKRTAFGAARRGG